MLLGFSKHADATALLQNRFKDEPETWLDALTEKSLQHQHHNQWAKHWHKQFLTDPDDIMAWAAFRLFLQCVDRRYWGWSELHCSDFEKRLRFLEDNDSTIKNAAKKNEKSLEEHFLGQKIMRQQVWPWL